MGILNITPDSFYDGGSFNSSEKAYKHAIQMIEDGADIIVAGGESSRPGAKPVTAQTEIDRICPIIDKIAKELPTVISVDTYKAEVADAALNAGATVVNDIGGLQKDPGMADIVSKHNADIIIMHMHGTPQNMQDNPQYQDIISEIHAFLNSSIKLALQKGIKKEKIIIDPGIGFGKTIEDNYKIINSLHEFKKLGVTILIGLSRKSLIGNIYEDHSKYTPENVDRLPGSIALNIFSILQGASIIRVHDVKQHRLALDSLNQLKRVSE